jgi:hypothetical protein
MEHAAGATIEAPPALRKTPSALDAPGGAGVDRGRGA